MQRARFQHQSIGISYLDSSPTDRQRPAVLLMHGFPDSAEMWAAQSAFLHEQGLRVIAPDMRGYGESDMAATTADYSVDCILADTLALLDHLGIAKTHVVGHDWGAVLAWMLAGRHPERVERLVAVSVGHPTAYARAGLDQKLAGWYTLYFLLRGLSERLLMGNSVLGMRQLLSTHPDIEEVLRRMKQPGRLTAALSIYRANLATVLFKRQPDVAAPTLGIWSRGDRYLVESQMKHSDRYMRGPWRCETIDGGHWIPLEHPDQLNALLLQHLRT